MNVAFLVRGLGGFLFFLSERTQLFCRSVKQFFFVPLHFSCCYLQSISYSVFLFIDFVPYCITTQSFLLLEQTPPRSRPPLGSRLWHAVNEWPVRILLECILVQVFFFGSVSQIFTVPKRSCGKVMFSQACVKNSIHSGGVYTPSGQTHPPPPLQADGYCSGWYASYWNAFLSFLQTF